jgi:radical SAM protein with 4Fe4S-binding SPASM domain
LVEFSKSLGLECRADPLIFPRNDGSKIPLAQRLSNEELALAYRYLGTSIVKKEPPLLSAREKSVCGAGHDSCCISPYGDVYPCVQFFLKFGNIRENSFRDIWYNSQTTLSHRRITNYADLPDCRSCGIVADCTRCPGLAGLEDGDYLGKSQEACRLTKAIIQVRQQLYKEGGGYGEEEKEI